MRTSSFTTTLLPAALLVLSACQSNSSRPPAPPSAQDRAEISNEFTASAQVVALSTAERMMTLRREDGTLLDIAVGEGVRNLDQVAVGDELRVHYKEVLAVRKLGAGESAPPAQAQLAAARAKPGAMPAAGVGVSVSVRVKIESIDRERDIVVFSLASGELLARRIQTSEGRDFVRRLVIGDHVQLEYAEVLALGVEEM